MTSDKKFSQKEKQQRGSQFEAEFRASCNVVPCWVYKMLTGVSGTPFDYIMAVENKAIAIELKRIVNNTLNYSAIRSNQRVGLTKFENTVSTNKSYIICNIKNDNENRCFVIPWADVKEDICSGAAGSIKVKSYTELPRIKIKNSVYGWDLSFLLRG